ncbi:MAG: YbgC/FadM family acyl-CoA thioesterase [Devosia sp.]
MSAVHRIEVRVYYEDTDFSGNVYHAAYLHFFERARTEFLRARGIHHSELARDGIAFAVKSMNIDFVRAAHIDDLLTIETEFRGIHRARFSLAQRAVRGGEDVATTELVVVAIRYGRAGRLPAAVIAALDA